MDTLSAFINGVASRGKPLMVFDWVKAATIIREKMPKTAWAGLEGDEEYTSGTIYRDGQIVANESMHLSSTWAKPQISTESERIDCYVMGSETNWNAETVWPPEARAILD